MRHFIKNAPVWMLVFVKDQVLYRALSEMDNLNGPLIDNLVLFLALLVINFPKQVKHFYYLYLYYYLKKYHIITD